MPLKARIIIILLGVSLFVFVLNLIRKRLLKIEYSILWLIVSTFILAASIWQDMADKIAYLIGIDYPPALFLTIAIFFLLVILMYFSIELSRLKDQIRTLIQELAIHENLIKKIEKSSKPIDEISDAKDG